MYTGEVYNIWQGTNELIRSRPTSSRDPGADTAQEFINATFSYNGSLFKLRPGRQTPLHVIITQLTGAARQDTRHAAFLGPWQIQSDSLIGHIGLNDDDVVDI